MIRIGHLASTLSAAAGGLASSVPMLVREQVRAGAEVPVDQPKGQALPMCTESNPVHGWGKGGNWQVMVQH